MREGSNRKGYCAAEHKCENPGCRGKRDIKSAGGRICTECDRDHLKEEAEKLKKRNEKKTGPAPNKSTAELDGGD